MSRCYTVVVMVLTSIGVLGWPALLYWAPLLVGCWVFTWLGRTFRSALAVLEASGPEFRLTAALARSSPMTREKRPSVAA